MNSIIEKMPCDAADCIFTGLTAPENILTDAPMAAYTTFRAGGSCDFLISPENTEELQKILAACTEHQIPYFILGRGSNLLVSDKGFRGAVISLRKHFSGISRDGLRITAGAGALLSQVSEEALLAGLQGFEFASGIPGTVGGAVRMNAGAYGSEMRDCVESAELLLPDSTIRTFSHDALELSYRSSVVEALSAVVLEATFLLTPGDPAEIRARMDDLNQRRRDKQPLELASAGSTFKRPAGFYAGKLIDDAGLRGFRIGNAGVSEKHAGFVVNYGGASASEIYQVILHVKEEVQRQFHVELEPEVRLLGDF